MKQKIGLFKPVGNDLIESILRQLSSQVEFVVVTDLDEYIELVKSRQVNVHLLHVPKRMNDVVLIMDAIKESQKGSKTLIVTSFQSLAERYVKAQAIRNAWVAHEGVPAQLGQAVSQIVIGPQS